MVILHVITNLSFGSGKAAIRLHEALIDQGIESHVLCLFSDSTFVRNSHIMVSKNYFFKLLRKLKVIKSREKVNSSYLIGRSKYYEMFTFCESDFDITNHPKYKKADIINFHWTGNFLDYPSFFKINKKPIVWSLSDMNPFTGGCHYSNGCMKFLNEDCENCPQLSGTLNVNQASFNLLKKQKYLTKSNSLIKIVTPANWLNELSKSSLLFKNFEHIKIPHASDENIYKPINKIQSRKILNLPADKVIVLFSSGSLKNERKNFSDLCKAINKLDNPNIHLLIIGKMDIEIPIKRTMYSVLGYLNDEAQLNVAYCASSAIVIPSIEDNLPLTLIDSMMSGIPSISYNIGGMIEHVIDGVNGIKAKKNNSDSLAEAINDLLNNKYNFDSSVIRNLALSRYSKSKHATEYVNFYNKILSVK